MSTWKSVLTEKGEALLAKMTQGSTLDITHAEVGAGTVDASLLKQQTSVSNVKQRATIEPVGYPEEGMCALPVTISNEGLSAGYSAWQIGVFANDPDEGSVLFFIAQAEDFATGIPSAALMPSYKTQIIFHLEYGDADLVNVDVNPANAVSQAAMENYVKNNVGNADTVDGKHASDFAAAKHEHFHNGLSSLVKHYTSVKEASSIASYFNVSPKRFSDIRDTGLWLVSSDKEYCDVYLPNTNIETDATQERYIRAKSPLLIMVAENSNERIRVIDVINGIVATAEVDDDGTTYNHTVGTIATNGYTYGTEDLEAGVSPLETGKLYIVYE